MINMILDDAKERMSKAIDSYKRDLATVRTGRASPAMLDRVMVNYYGSPTPVNQIAGISVVASGVFQGLGKSVYSLVLSLIRQLGILIPAAYLLSLTGNLTAVWFSFPIAEVAGLCVTVFYMRRMSRNLDNMIEEKA